MSHVRLVQCSSPVRSVIPMFKAESVSSPTRSDWYISSVGLLIISLITASRLGSGKVTMGEVTVKPPVLVAVPSGVVTETSLVPVVAEPLIVILPVICVELSTEKELTFIPEPKLTELAPVRQVPVIVTLVSVWP